MFLTMTVSINNLLTISQVLTNTEKLEAHVLTLRRNEKDFLARNDLKYLTQFNENSAKLQNNISAITELTDRHGINLPELRQFQTISQDYVKKFNHLVTYRKNVGLNPKDGLYGELRAAVHEVETLLSENDSYRLLADMLQLRRAEKDFMLRRDTKYLDKYKSHLTRFYQDLNNEGLSSQNITNIKSKLSVYSNKFNELVEREKTIGLTPKLGLLGDLRGTIHETETLLKTITSSIAVEFENKITNNKVTAIITFLIAMFVSLSLVYLTSQSILKPILAVRDAIGVIRAKNDLTWLVKSKGKDELVDMAEDINSLVNDFRSLIINVDSALKILDQATEQLANNTEKTMHGMKQQFVESDMVATSGAEMQATVADINENTQLATQTANQAGDLAASGAKEVNQTAQNIQDLANQLQDALSHIEKLEKDSQSIGTVSDAIRGIAEQTNLLALNAAIEAARAGEQGRGFAVVADEVRSLAMRTQESTSEIENIIGSLQSSTQTIVNVVNQCYQNGLICSEQAQSAGTSLLNIANQVNEMVVMNNQISNALREQDQVATEMSKHVVKIRDIAESSKENAEINAEASRGIANQASVLHKEIEVFKTTR